ncbi:hypothetical protein V6N13_108625 [Hibiscus sabdariffa]
MSSNAGHPKCIMLVILLRILRQNLQEFVQNFGNLAMVAKPLFGILSDALYIGGGHRIPYICIGGQFI